MAMLFACAVSAQEDMTNFRRYSPTLASAGQPTAAQLLQAVEAGYQRVVYLALSDQDQALPHEDRLVREAGMQFVHLPIIWKSPSAADFALFSAVMRQGEGLKTLVHCQVNWRASSFVFLHRVIDLGVPINEAVVDLNAVWTPDATWSALIVEILREAGIDPNCALCDWQGD
jgi:protein tyrosine phosphatase (PTP) superfamily phosphohydrolase (DUF442 family)